ncbi:MAG: hypothetical protein EA341_11580 [Mongoliibacter sp.]|uniref:hypothetical protein n=1 Tax=Mongoliibacter sp. TaxID=2022438 RepID=UPI0012F15E97|nr:hypothetical protein [Mongoliibacter sp.]TVP48119.1 MAG: hypothetical protein EA341_11580 [Mongoliibacter sp.]
MSQKLHLGSIFFYFENDLKATKGKLESGEWTVEWNSFTGKTIVYLRVKNWKKAMESKVKFKELLQIAIENLKDLSTVQEPDFRLEQAVFNEHTKEWDIVVSFLVDNTNQRTSPFELPGLKNQRIFKKLKVNSNKEVLGFYIYEN